MRFAEQLKITRIQLGYKSTQLYYKYLKSKHKVSFNYAYLRKIELGEVLPSNRVANEICNSLSKQESLELAQAYCQDCFPSFGEQLFKSAPQKTIKPIKKIPKSVLAVHQKELNERQVASIAKSSAHYFLFLQMTLSRQPISRKALEKKYGSVFDQVISDLESTDLLVCLETDEVQITHNEFKFPIADNESLKKLYKQIDQYDLKINDFFSLKEDKYGTFFKRVSPRYLPLIRQQIETLFMTIRASDEISQEHNELAFSLSIKSFIGEIEG
jgi:hypothetical protein